MSETVHDVVPPASNAGKESHRGRWFAIGAVVVAAASLGLITAGGIGKNLVYYWGPAELHAAGDKAVGATIRLGGKVAEGSVRYGEGASHLEFDVADGKAVVHVRSRGVPPQMFREGIGVVVEGTMMRGGYFQSDRLMVSHNNEYRAPKAGEAINAKQLIKSTKGLE
jgi:cytochrome c-type biogenesis protein CcmE